MANKIITVRNDRTNSISLDTVDGLVPLQPGDSITVIVTPEQYARIVAISRLFIVAGGLPDSATSFLNLIKEQDLNVDVFDQSKLVANFDKIDTFAGLISKAIAGNMYLVISPTADVVTESDQNAVDGYTRVVTIKLMTSPDEEEGAIHTWYNGDLSVSIDDVSSGTAAIEDDTPPMVAGVAEVHIACTGTWSPGTRQVTTATVLGTISTAGDAKVTVTATGLCSAGDEKDISVPVALDDDAAAIAVKIREALAADTDVSAMFTVSGTEDGTDVVLTKISAAADDDSLNIAIDNDTCAGITTAATSVDTEPGVAPDTNTLTVNNLTVMGYTVTGGTSVETTVFDPEEEEEEE